LLQLSLTRVVPVADISNFAIEAPLAPRERRAIVAALWVAAVVFA